ncbi:hypothetical protein GII33_21315 [Gordonia pseudamarae]|jgi:hypothetical protein|uniref:Uncharacterized protein n=1 Tax=Gordonia pseudamarae TaxID=2831662 RepID=A0ABX6IM69_9ACTN|nr:MULTISPECIES: hypothetical protein [Gordonia]MBD0023833.1 hypothetical protein [Gordonia sp. (in: high G+C Gram-positive bacteria)]QHN28136.1 hypothetical protein GII33_21315 [Gordonia pseudamarae]QHN36999.1 hypothetical protein GII31_20950 [Gordonia pseudamarae]
MTRNAAEKRAAREYARKHGVTYRSALDAMRASHHPDPPADLDRFVTRLLIEAVEGFGIRHWARIDSWDGAAAARITDVSGETFHLDADTVGPVIGDFIAIEHLRKPLDLDAYLADEIIQTALFGFVIYRPTVRRRPRIDA